MKKIIIIISICSFCVLLSVFLVNMYLKMPINYTELYDYSAAYEIAEQELNDYIIENNYTDYKIISSDKALNFGSLYRPKSKIDFADLKGIIIIVYEVEAISTEKNETEKFHYGVVMSSVRGVVEFWDKGTHLNNVNRIIGYIID